MLGHELSLFILQKTSVSASCIQVLGRFFGPSIGCTCFGSEQQLINAVHKAAADPYDYCNTDVLLVADGVVGASKQSIFQLQLKLRTKPEVVERRYYGWAGQMIVVGGSDHQARERANIWPFTAEGGLTSVSTNTAVVALLHCLHKRKVLSPGRWKQAMDNLCGLKEFWVCLGSSVAASRRKEWEDAKYHLQTGIGFLIADRENEFYFGHKRFRFLQRVHEQCRSSATAENWVQELIEQSSCCLRQYQLNDFSGEDDS